MAHLGWLLPQANGCKKRVNEINISWPGQQSPDLNNTPKTTAYMAVDILESFRCVMCSGPRLEQIFVMQ